MVLRELVDLVQAVHQDLQELVDLQELEGHQDLQELVERLEF